MVAALLLLVFAFDGALVLWEGFVLVTILTWYLASSVYKSRKDIKNNEMEPLTPRLSLLKAFGLVAFASVGLYFGADILVESAKNIAITFGVSERVVAISVVALGTSLPELATSVIAACRKQMDISVGNIIGSNIFNILGVLGVTSIIKKISVDKSILEFDIFWMIAISFLLYILVAVPRRQILQRWNGIVFVMVYLSYIAIVFCSKI